MIDAAEQARSLVEGRSVSVIESDRVLRDALLWNFTVLGEAAGSVSDEVKARFARVPWRNPSQLRNRVVHGYWSVDIEILHTTASRQLGEFVVQLQEVLSALADEEPTAPGILAHPHEQQW